MFDFLNQSKRQIIFQHPVLNRLSPYPQALQQFLENFTAFESDLRSKYSKIGQKRPEQIFTDDDINRVRNYINLLLSDSYKEMIKLSEKIFKEAGVEVWHHAGFRADINDWINDERYYSRGVHNFQENLYREHLENPNLASVDFVVPLDILLSSQTNPSFHIKVQIPHHAEIGPIRLLHYADPSNLSNVFRSEEPFPGEHNQDNLFIRSYDNPLIPTSFYFRCGLFCLDQKYEIQRKQIGVRPKTIKEKHHYFGFLGVKKEKIINEPVIRETRVFKGGKILHLNQIITTNETGPAYLLQFFLPKVVPDRMNRVGAYPLVHVVASKSLVEETTSFLLKYPDLYVDFIRGFLPAQMFPNINRGILNASSLQSKGIIFDNFTDFRRITIK